MEKRVFLIVLDSLGIGAMPDADKWNDEGSNTLKVVRAQAEFFCPTLTEMGLFSIDGIEGKIPSTRTCYARLEEKSRGKDTTTGHWELAGLISEQPFPTYPNGFPKSVIEEFERETGRGTLCNKPYSGTEVIKDYGEEHIKTGKLIVYTSADSVFQIAAHESVVPVAELYRYCEVARKLLQGEHAVGRVIARPFAGEEPYIRTPRRHDYSLSPPADTMPALLTKAGYEVVSVGKIYDIFAGVGFTQSHPTKDNDEGMEKTLALAKEKFTGLCFVNLVDFDSKYGHRNDAVGYAKALTAFDRQLKALLPLLREEDLLIITADHGCDPSTPSTDHSREYVPMLAYGERVKKGVNLGTRAFADVGATVLEWFDLSSEKISGKSFAKEIRL